MVFNTKISVFDNTVGKTPKSHLTFWCGKFCQKVQFRRVLAKTGDWTFPKIFHIKKLGEITEFYVVTKNEMSPHFYNFIMAVNHGTSIKRSEKSNIIVTQTLKQRKHV